MKQTQLNQIQSHDLRSYRPLGFLGLADLLVEICGEREAHSNATIIVMRHLRNKMTQTRKYLTEQYKICRLRFEAFHAHSIFVPGLSKASAATRPP